MSNENGRWVITDPNLGKINKTAPERGNRKPADFTPFDLLPMQAKGSYIAAGSYRGIMELGEKGRCVFARCRYLSTNKELPMGQAVDSFLDRLDRVSKFKSRSTALVEV